jgi:flagellar protein FliO/FliZ
MRRTILNFLATIAPLAAYADQARPFASPAAVESVAPSGVGSLGQVTLALALVLALIFGVAWSVRRMRGFGKPQGAALDVIANLPLGQKERAVLIRCGSTQILLGVAPGQVNTLHVLVEPVEERPQSSREVAEGASPRPDFKSVLKRSLGL